MRFIKNIILYTTFVLILSLNKVFWYDNVFFQEDIIPRYTIVDWQSNWSWLSLITNLLLFVKNSIFRLLPLIVIWVLIYLWGRLVVARWKPDEFKKVLNNSIYVVIWIFLVGAAWAIVKIISWLTF